MSVSVDDSILPTVNNLAEMRSERGNERMNEVSDIAAMLIDGGVLLDGAQFVPLGGGVSCDVWRVSPDYETEKYRDLSPHGLVVKVPLARLRVPTTWEVEVSRGRAEAEALLLFGRITPGAVPGLLWQDTERPTIAMQAAPRNWEEWRKQLNVRPPVDPLLASSRITRICTALGRTLARWHTQTQDMSDLPDVLTTGDRLRTLRTDPFHRAAAAELPDSAGVLYELADELEAERTCLVHGDFSSKNFLVSPSTGLWVLDAEVAHVGNPALDVAFLSAHLLLHAVWRPELCGRLDAGRLAFQSAYRASSSLVTERTWNRQTGAILAARVCGVSRVEELSEANRTWVVAQAQALMSGRNDLDQVWRAI